VKPAPPTHPSTDPSRNQRKSLLSRPGTLFLVALALLYGAFLLGYIPHGLADRLYASISTQRDTVLAYGRFVKAAIILTASFLLYIMLVPFGGRRRKKSLNRTGRRGSMQTVHEFAQECAPFRIGPKVSSRGYHYLRPFYQARPGKPGGITLQDRLIEDLNIPAAELDRDRTHLLTACHRSHASGWTRPPLTVLELLLYLESAPLSD
jgi:hypothetical protein